MRRVSRIAGGARESQSQAPAAVGGKGGGAGGVFFCEQQRPNLMFASRRRRMTMKGAGGAGRARPRLCENLGFRVWVVGLWGLGFGV